ncbi:nuclear pore complex Nup93/Nic96 family protein [Wolbachia endosymbiont of Drosophila nikananu]|nr:nuclear pore complex Nup93/Nic96 family protein [Wolbachia endosymbiont of Drosophila nikananu]MDE5061019.1 nuclear pore complex Nup93/Nic96 family protein [Wolbachia endosymbiont of Drosophila nikananu]
MLGSKGVDLPKMTQKLESLSARNSLEPIDPIQDTDVRGYLKNERENAILSVIEETNRNVGSAKRNHERSCPKNDSLQVFSSVERQKWRSVYSEWGNMKESLLNALVGPSQQDFPDLQRQKVTTELPDEPTPLSRLSHFEALYAKEITSYNASHIQGGHRTNLVATFAELAEKSFDDPLVTEMWNVLNYMANVTPMSRNIDPIHSRQTAPQFIQQARTYLERRYKIYMYAVTEKNLVIARRGGIPNIYNLVSSYVGVQFQQSHTIVGLLNVDKNGKPLWPHVYYSLRCGDTGAAVQFLKESGTSPELLKLMTLQRLGDTTSESSSNTKLEGQLKLEYNNKLRICSDPYKKAVYAIVLACDPHDGHAELIRTIDDFLWMQLSILREQEKRDYNIEQLTYSGLQSLILEKYGENYFNAREKAPLYFQVLALTGQFESAIEFLARNQNSLTHAVHMAIALNELCLLGTPKSINEPLLSAEPDDPAPMKRLNLVRLVVMYAKCFEQTDTAQALQYYYLLRHFKTEDRGPNAMLTCVSDLLVENCDDDMLTLIFGVEDEQNSNRFTGGIFAEFHTMDYDMYSLAGMVGDELSNRSNYESAIKLYYIAGQLDKALSLVCSLLSQVVHQPPRPCSMRERLSYVIQSLDAALVERKTDVRAHVLITYTTLSRLMEFFDLVNAGETRLASEILANHRLVPSNSTEVDECVTNLKRMGPEIIKVMPDVILAAMNIVYAEYMEQRCGPDSGNVDETQNENREAVLRHLRGRAKALTNMAASVPYRMPAAINQRLVQLEILML